MLGHRIWGKRLGIIGMGRIGQAVARRARAFGLQIHYHNRRRVPAQDRGGARPPPTGRASTRCSPAWTSSRSTARTRRRPITCSRRAGSSSSGPRPIIVNTARGEVIDENALVRLIASRRRSPAPASTCSSTSRRSTRSSSARAHGKVVLLPHMGSATLEGRIDMGEKVIINIKTFLDGHRPAGSSPALDALTDRITFARRAASGER